MSLSETIQNYTEDIAEMNFEYCPEAFAIAFGKHKLAWKEMLDVTDNYPNLRGEMHDLFKILETGKDSSLFNPRLKAIWDTWSEVEEAMQE